MRSLVILLATTSLAFASDVHEIDFTQTLVDVTGKPVCSVGLKDKSDPCPDKSILTLGEASIQALEATLKEDEKDTGAVKFKRDQLARKVYENAHATLEAKDIATIVERIGKAYGPPVIGAAWPLLDPNLSHE